MAASVGGLFSWTPEESQVESYEYQDDANIHCQSFPESISEECEIYADDDGHHRHHVEHPDYPTAHFSKTSFHCRLSWVPAPFDPSKA
jgi:hypothetical protein